MSIGERLEEAMLMKGVKTSDMAKKLGISRGHITDIIKGRIQTPKKNIYKICDFLNISVIWLSTGIGDTFQNQDIMMSYILVDGCLKENRNINPTLSIELKGLIPIEMNKSNHFDENTIVFINKNEKGDGLYLVYVDDDYKMSIRDDLFTRSIWSSIPNGKDFKVIGKIINIINYKAYEHEIKNTVIK